MSVAIVMNLITLAVVVGGWTAAVRAIGKGLGDPYARTAASRRPGQAPAASSRPEPVLAGRRAA